MRRLTRLPPLPARVAVCLALGVAAAGPPTAAAEDVDRLDLKKLFHDGIPESPFIDVIYGYADTMLKHGRDTRAAKNCREFLSALDRKTLAPLGSLPPAPAGVREELRPGGLGAPAAGSDVQLDQNLLRLLYFLGGLSGEDRYPRAADAALGSFLERARARAAPGFPPLRSLRGPWLLWDECFRLSPAASRRWLRESLTAPLAKQRSPRQAGFLLRSWADGSLQTGAAEFRGAIEALLNEYEKPALPPEYPFSDYLSLAIDAGGAARKVPEPLRWRLRRLAARVDARFCSVLHDVGATKGFILSQGPPHRRTRLWGAGHAPSTASVAVMCVSRYQNTGKTAYRDLLVAAADAYSASLPGETGEKEVDAWPLAFGQVITLYVAAYGATSQERYFRRAFQLGELAIEKFFGDRPLPRASFRSEHYESTTGAPTLVLALTELHLLTRQITAVRAPVNTADR